MAKAKCEAKTTRGSCQRVAGWGTDHFGVGRCKKHDIIASSVQHELPPAPTIKSLAEQFLQDREPFELREEIAICRAAVDRIIEQVDNEQSDLVRSAPAINQLLNTIGKLVQRLHDIEEGRRYVVRVDQVQLSLQQLLAVVVEYVPNPHDRAALADRIATLELPGAQPDLKPIALTTKETELLRSVTENRG